MNALQILGIALTLGLVAAAGIWSGRKVKNARDFAVGGAQAGAMLVTGTIVGTLVGGSSTIGTAQLAHQVGHSALWFTIGGGIGCLVLGLFFARPLRRSGKETIQQMIAAEYGQSAGFWCSVLGALGIFLNIVAQLLSSMALLGALLPISPLACALVSAGIMACYVIFGGVKGTGLVGTIKMVLLYAIVLICGISALNLSGGLASLAGALPKAQYFSLFARGVGTDLGAGLSLVLGVLSTQTYAQAILSAKNDRTAVKGALFSAVLIPPIGFGGVYIGMYMKLFQPDILPTQAFPQFILLHMPDFFAGVALATLFIAVVGTGAGLALGISAIITNNLYGRLRPAADPKQLLLVSRIAIVSVLALAVLFTLGDLQSVILQWSFMSMGLRAAVIFLPMCGALFFHGKVRRPYAMAAIFAGPLAVLAGNLLSFPWDPLFLGIAAAAACIAVGLIHGKAPQPTER